MPLFGKRFRNRRQRQLLLLACVGALGLVVGVVAVIVVLRGPGPADVVDTYIGAIQRGDFKAAYAELAEVSKRSIQSPEGLRQTAVPAMFRNGIVETYEIGKTRKEQDRTLVEVKFSKGSTETVVNIFVTREDGRWKVEV